MAPFTQLLTINAFVRSEDHAKQVPLVFVLMSGKRKKEYRVVIREILKLLPSQPSVRKITVDFESAIWSTFRKLLPEVGIMECAFHWTQALWRKVSIKQCHIRKKKLLSDQVSLTSKMYQFQPFHTNRVKLDIPYFVFLILPLFFSNFTGSGTRTAASVHK